MISATVSNILALVSRLLSSRRYSRQILMLQAYFDGSTQQDTALIFAGHLASVDTWLKFSGEWEELLTIHPRLEAFKMSDMTAYNSDGSLKLNTSTMERAMFHYKLIDRLPIFGLSCAIPIHDLTKVISELGIDTYWNNPYYLAWRAVITMALEGAGLLGLIDPIEFIFDEQSDKVRVINSWDNFYNSCPISYRRKIQGTPSFKDDKNIMPLQAADLIAWWARRQYIIDKTRMKDLYPIEWTGGKAPHLLATHMPEEAIRTQFLKDIEIARQPKPTASSHTSLLRGEPWK